MAKLIATIKAVITRLLFGTHGFIAIWQVARNKENSIYWYLCAPIGLLFLEGLFTLAIKKTQEWRWFCPSVFLYLVSVVPAIWLLELDKIERRLRFEKETGNLNLTAIEADLKKLDKLLGVQIKLPDIQVDPSTWITLIEQFLMLILIVGRWMLPKGDLTRDQLSQLLLVYIGTAADIIEFFDSYKDNTIASEQLLVFLTLGIWSWSLLQFTIVLSATRSRKPRGGGSSNQDTESNTCCGGCCCSIDVWGIALNILLQDAPFLAFRLLIIVHYRIISYMNVFFTCKNTLVILLQLYRLYVVHTENSKAKRKKKKLGKHSSDQQNEMNQLNDIYIISSGKIDKKKSKRANCVGDISEDERRRRHHHKHQHQQQQHTNNNKKKKKGKSGIVTRKDTGYSTASSKSNDEKHRLNRKHHKQIKDNRSSNKGDNKSTKNNKHDDHSSGGKQRNDKKNKHNKRHSSSSTADELRKEKKTSKKEKELTTFTEESDEDDDDDNNNNMVDDDDDNADNTSENSSKYEIVHEKHHKNKRKLSISSSFTSEE